MGEQGDFRRMGKHDVPAEWNTLSERIVGAAIEVHRTIGPGMLERLYEDALVHELTLRGMSPKRQVAVDFEYKGLALVGQRLDLVVNDLIVVEVKAITHLPDVAVAQLVSYMRAGSFPLGLLFNFHALLLKDSIISRINSEAIAQRHP